MNSFSDQAQLTCPHCNHNFVTEVWLFVDAGERPDLADRARAESLHQIPCPNCGAMGMVDVPLLFYKAEGNPPLFFSPAQRTSEDQDQEQAQMLVGIARERMGDAWKDEWVTEGLPGVPRHLVRAALSDDPEAVMREMDQQAAEELERLKEQDPEEFERLQGEAGQVLASDPVVDALWTLMDAEGWENTKQIVEAHPELLEEQAEHMLLQMEEAARTQKDESALQVFEQHRKLLQRCREVGIDEAFAPLIQGEQPAAEDEQPQ